MIFQQHCQDRRCKGQDQHQRKSVRDVATTFYYNHHHHHHHHKFLTKTLMQVAVIHTHTHKHTHTHTHTHTHVPTAQENTQKHLQTCTASGTITYTRNLLIPVDTESYQAVWAHHLCRGFHSEIVHA